MYVCFVRCNMKAITVYIYLCVLMSLYDCLMLKKECSQDEVHKSCSFYEEYTCWETPELNKRVKTTPKRLTHCRSGCFCNKGFVRAYPEGKCITELTCRDQELLATLKKIPNKTFDF